MHQLLTALKIIHTIYLQNVHYTFGLINSYSFFGYCISEASLTSHLLPQCQFGACYFVIKNPVLSSYSSYQNYICVCV